MGLQLPHFDAGLALDPATHDEAELAAKAAVELCCPPPLQLATILYLCI